MSEVVILFSYVGVAILCYAHGYERGRRRTLSAWENALDEAEAIKDQKRKLSPPKGGSSSAPLKYVKFGEQPDRSKYPVVDLEPFWSRDFEPKQQASEVMKNLYGID